MDLGLGGKTVLVAGASAGLGYAAAEALAQEGANLVISSRSAEHLRAAAERIEKATGIRPVTVTADLATTEGIGRITEAVQKDGTAGRVDILVSNAGGPPPGQFLDHTPEAWEGASRLVLDMAIGLTRAVLPGMIERKWGRLIYITSVGVLQPIDSLVLSNTYRAGVAGFCKTISNNYAKHGITANCVCPGYTATERLQNLAASLAEKAGQTPEEIMAGFAESTPAGRVGKPEELAALITFLAGEPAAYITGASIAVDGGLNRAIV
jgi:3-oxoacyl-[acyl-carrier protein] reductase